MIDFRAGRWQDILADVETCDVLLTDPPYSERTHNGFRSGSNVRQTNLIDYSSMNEIDAYRFVDHWASRVTGWALMFGDHVSVGWWADAWAEAGWYTFAPVIWWRTDAPPRMSGDGPASPCDRLMVARPKSKVRLVGHRPGLYKVRTGATRSSKACKVIGVKDVQGLTRLLADYSRPGDVIVDTHGGTATIGAAAKATGRNYIGSEVDPQTYAIGVDRLANTQETPDWSWPDRWRDKDVTQPGLLGDVPSGPLLPDGAFYESRT